MEQRNFSIEYYLQGNPQLEVHKTDAGLALFNPAANEYITQFGVYTHFGPYVCDCIAVRTSEDRLWGIITLKGEIVLSPAYDYVDYPFRIEKVSYVDFNNGKECGEYQKVYHPIKGRLYYGYNDISLNGISEFDCEEHKSLKPHIDESDFSFLKGFFASLD